MTKEYYKSKESVEEYIELAKDVNGRKLIEKLMQVLPSNSVVLEIGSGPGTDWRILNESYKVIGSDFSTEFLNYLISNNPKGEFLELDAITLKTDKKFDGIFSNKVLHHLRDNELKESVKKQYEILNSNGIICHSFWKGEGSEIFKGLFVNYQNELTLREMYQVHFEILSIQEYNEFEPNDSLILIARKKQHTKTP